MKLPVYSLTFNPEDGGGVDFVALVDSPATQHNWMAFKDRQLFKANEEKRIISGALMVAGMPIYRRDEERGEYYVVFSSDTIAQIRDNFFRLGHTSRVNQMHTDEKAHGVYMVESFIIDSERGIKTPEGFDELPEGSWFGSYKVENDAIWNDFIKTGKFKGFSVEGVFDLVPALEEDEQVLDALADLLSGKEGRNFLRQMV